MPERAIIAELTARDSRRIAVELGTLGEEIPVSVRFA
jgi:hypothetical protein